MGVLSNTAYFKKMIYPKLILDFMVILKFQISYQMSTQVILRTNHYDSVHLIELPVPLPLATSKIQWTPGGSVQPSLLVYTEKNMDTPRCNRALGQTLLIEPCCLDLCSSTRSGRISPLALEL